MRFGGGSVDVLQDFTDDHSRLLSIIETLIVGGESASPRTLRTMQTQQIPEQPSARTVVNSACLTTDRQLSALQTAAKMLGPV